MCEAPIVHGACRWGTAVGCKWSGNRTLLVRDWAENSDGEVREQRSAFIKLQPAHDAIVFQIFPYARFADAEMFGKFFLQIRAFAAAAPASKQIPDADAQGLAGLDVVVAGLVRIGNEENARASGRVLRKVHGMQRAGQKAAKLGFELGHTRGKRRITRTTARLRRRSRRGGFKAADRLRGARPAFGNFLGNKMENDWRWLGLRGAFERRWQYGNRNGRCGHSRANARALVPPPASSAPTPFAAVAREGSRDWRWC